MNTAAIIAEYNPFHNGHAHQLGIVRERSGADCIIVLMSGPFVQRGAPAIFDAHLRARAALLCGADLVLELPVAAATANAGVFARGAVAILDALGVVDELWFGSECGEIKAFRSVAALIRDREEAWERMLRDALREGLTYPAARMQAIRRCCADEAALPAEELEQLLAGPNNILGLEYCMALDACGSAIRPQTHAMAEDDARHIAHANAIRPLLFSDPKAAAAFFPEPVVALFLREADANARIDADDFSDPLFYQLLKENPASLAAYAGISQELANRIASRRGTHVRISSLAEELKSRNYTRTHIDRALMHILLGIKKEDEARLERPAFVRALGMADCGDLISRIAQRGRIPLHIRTHEIPPEQFARDRFAADLYETVLSKKSGRAFRNACSRGLARP